MFSFFSKSLANYNELAYDHSFKDIEGEFLGRLVLGVEGDDVKVFGATIY